MVGVTGAYTWTLKGTRELQKHWGWRNIDLWPISTQEQRKLRTCEETLCVVAKQYVEAERKVKVAKEGSAQRSDTLTGYRRPCFPEEWNWEPKDWHQMGQTVRQRQESRLFIQILQEKFFFFLSSYYALH